MESLSLLTLIVHIAFNIYAIAGQNTCSTPQPDDTGEFVKLSAISKYFHYDSRVQNPFSYTYTQAQEICKRSSLELAEITSLTDMTSLRRFVSEARDRYWIGMNDIDNEGDFVESDGITKIRFQAFTGSNPDNGDGDEDCVQVVYNEGIVQMDDKACETTAGVLCQFPRGSYCSINSFQQNSDVGQDLIPLGASTHYFVSQVQKTKAQAYGACLMAGKYLLAFNSKKGNEELMQEMKFYRTITDMGPQTTFWTGGSVLKDDMGVYTGSVFWDILDHEYSYKQNPMGLQFTWGYGEPSNSYGSEKDCLDVSYENVDTMSGPPVPVWRASNCLLPKFYICMDLNMTIPMDEMPKNDAGRQEQDQTSDQECDSLITKVNPPAMNLLKPLSVDQTMNLMLFALKNNFHSGKTKMIVKESISWKRNIIELIFNIFKKSVATDLVPHGFLSSVQEINLIYQNAVSGGDKSMNPDGWKDTIVPVLKKCLDSSQELPFSTIGLKIRYYNSTWNPENLMKIPQEQADLYTNLDMALDALWYIFSFNLGICFRTAGKSSSTWASQFYILFTIDFMEKLEEKWVMKDDANILKQSLIFGNVDIFTSMDNLRAATTAAYLKNEILDRQVVRPISLEKLEGKKIKIGYQRVNFKTGINFNEL